MKKIVLTITTIFIINFGCEKIDSIDAVDIPDKEFLRYLLSQGIDIDKDYKISYAEAELLTYIDLGSLWEDWWAFSYNPDSPDYPITVENLKGIEAFIYLDTLICNYCRIKEIDISKNTALTYLDCGRTMVTTLDVSKNTALTYLDCGRTMIITLDVSKNTALTYLACWGNDLTTLDVSKNTALTDLSCGYNALTSLDISNNMALKRLFISDMSTLGEVCVWTMPFPPVGVNLFKDNSPNVYFTMDCSGN